MFPINAYIYIFLVFIWVAYTVNAFFQNRKMKHFLPYKRIELLTIPFYVFAFAVFLKISLTLASIFIGKEIVSTDTASNLILVEIIGIIFCCTSIVLYTYINVFEKSFPSCLAITGGKRLTGIYNYIRHPSYYIFFFIAFGTSFSLSSPTLFIMACVNHISLYFYYMIEENQLKKVNADYNDYLKRTRRFFPVISARN